MRKIFRTRPKILRMYIFSIQPEAVSWPNKVDDFLSISKEKPQQVQIFTDSNSGKLNRKFGSISVGENTPMGLGHASTAHATATWRHGYCQLRRRQGVNTVKPPGFVSIIVIWGKSAITMNCTRALPAVLGSSYLYDCCWLAQFCDSSLIGHGPLVLGTIKQIVLIHE